MKARHVAGLRSSSCAGPAPGVSDAGDVDGLRPLVPALFLVLHPRALGQRAIAVGDDRAVVNEEVLASRVGRDEPEALVVAEPLHGSAGHIPSVPSYLLGAGCSP